MESLRIRLFGSLEITQGGNRLPSFATRKARSLFSYLLLHPGNSHPRDVLLGTFWGEYPESVARKHLRDALWRMRRVLAAQARGVELVVEDHAVALTLSRVWMDTTEFEARLDGDRGAREAMGDADAHRLRQALELYRGELLQEIYDDWCVHERERLRLLALDALQRLMVFHLEREEWPQALGWGQRLLAMEPLHERVHRTVMRCHARIGNRGAALKQYRKCERLLREEFQVQPMQDTIALYEQIRRGPLRSQGNPGSGLDTASGGRRTAEEALRRLRSADRDLVRSRRHLRDGARAIRRADALTGDP